MAAACPSAGQWSGERFRNKFSKINSNQLAAFNQAVDDWVIWRLKFLKKKKIILSLFNPAHGVRWDIPLHRGRHSSNNEEEQICKVAECKLF